MKLRLEDKGGNIFQRKWDIGSKFEGESEDAVAEFPRAEEVTWVPVLRVEVEEKKFLPKKEHRPIGATQAYNDICISEVRKK